MFNHRGNREIHREHGEKDKATNAQINTNSYFLIEVKFH